LVMNKLVAPAVEVAYKTSGLFTQGGSIVAQTATKTIGAFTAWPLFVVLAVAILAFWLLFKPEKANVRPIYLCGENTGEIDSTSFLSTADQAVELSLSNYYFSSSLDEIKLNKVGNVIAIIVIIMLLGVTVI